MKRILILGASSTIAHACARLWATEGASFFLVARDNMKLQCIADDLRARTTGAVHCALLDFNDSGGHADLLSQAITALGAIDIALLAHGTLPDQAACETDVALTLEALATNAGSVLALLTLLAQLMEQQGQGRLVVISSVAGDRGRASNYVYASAKAAVSVFCAGLRIRLLGSGVSVIDIRPGFVDTPMTQGLPLPTLLLAQPESVARRMVAGIEKRKAVLYVPAWWSVLMFIIRNIPDVIFRRLNL